MKILSIDVGLLNLALVYAHIDSYFNIICVEYCYKINLTDYYNCQLDNCQLVHNKQIHCYMAHLFIEYGTIFEESDKILVEQQPPLVLVSVEQIIFFKYPDKCIPISPSSMHAFFQINGMHYDLRKKMTVKFAEEYLKNFECFKNSERKHDLSDSMMFIIFFTSIERQKLINLSEIENHKSITRKFVKNIEEFKYTGD